MVEALCHERFYLTGTHVDQRLGVYVGWTARKNSFCDGMPLSNERGDVSLVFSGEEFPQPGTPRLLRGRGHMVEAEGPSYLVHVYEEDPLFPKTLNGRFHGLLTDRARGTALLFNDRYGMHRVYYHESTDAFYFAAEAKAILAVRPELRRIDPRGLGELVACGCVLENRTLFKGIRVLPPGSAWTFREGTIGRKSEYFQPPEWENQATLGPEGYYRELRDVFSRNLSRYFNGGEQVGMSLTGGLDSRMIMAWHHSAPGSLPCYTFGGPYRDCHDVAVARKIANACSQPHQVINVGKKFLSRFPHYAERSVYLTDGCAPVHWAGDLYAHEQARLIAPVRMTGNYGSEVLRWTPAFKPVSPRSGVFCPEFLSHVEEAGATYTSTLQGHPVSFAVFQQAPWYHHGLLSLQETQLSVRTPYLDNDFIRAVYRSPAASFSRRDTANVDLCLRLIADGAPALRRIPTDRGLGGRGRLSSAALRALLEFTFKAEYAYDYGMPQWLATIDHLASPLHLERLFLGRHKFCHFRVWYRDALSEYVREMLLDPRTLSRPYLNRSGVEAVVRGHIKGNRNYTTEIHKLLTLELLHRLFIDP
jgi:asparagine synthase (glutamine-hydrolysing)